jgi:hypothetical protein
MLLLYYEIFKLVRTPYKGKGATVLHSPSVLQLPKGLELSAFLSDIFSPLPLLVFWSVCVYNSQRMVYSYS